MDRTLLNAFIGSLISSSSLATELVLAEPNPTSQPSRAEVCAIVTTLPGVSETDELLIRLGSDHHQLLSKLAAMKNNMQQYEAEKYS